MRMDRVFSSMMISAFVIVAVGCGGVVDVPPATPEVVSTEPAEGTTVALAVLGSGIKVTFSKAIKFSSITPASFSVEDREGNGNAVVSGTVSLSGDGLVSIFRPDVPFSATTYKVTLTPEMTDLSGNPLTTDPDEVDFSWSFVTIP